MVRPVTYRLYSKAGSVARDELINLNKPDKNWITVMTIIWILCNIFEGVKTHFVIPKQRLFGPFVDTFYPNS